MCWPSRESRRYRTCSRLSLRVVVIGFGVVGSPRQINNGIPEARAQAPALGGEELGVNVSEATVKGAADLKLIGGNVAKHEASLNVLGPGVADIGGGLADSHLFDEEAAFSADGFDVFFKASGEAESRVEGLGVKDALEHCFEVLCGLPLDQSMAYQLQKRKRLAKKRGPWASVAKVKDLDLSQLAADVTRAVNLCPLSGELGLALFNGVAVEARPDALRAGSASDADDAVEVRSHGAGGCVASPPDEHSMAYQGLGGNPHVMQ